MRAREASRLSGDGGAAIIEAALVLPMLLFLILGGIDFAYLEMRQSQVTSGARDGARVAILRPSGANLGSGANYTAINTAVRARLAGTPITSVVVRCYSTTTIGVGVKQCSVAELDKDTVEVTVNWSYQPMTFVGQTFLGTSKNFTSTARMIIVGQPAP